MDFCWYCKLCKVLSCAWSFLNYFKNLWKLLFSGVVLIGLCNYVYISTAGVMWIDHSTKYMPENRRKYRIADMSLCIHVFLYVFNVIQQLNCHGCNRPTHFSGIVWLLHQSQNAARGSAGLTSNCPLFICLN